MIRNTCLAIALAALASTILRADYYEGLSAFKRGDYEQAFDEWQPLAEQGFVEAQYQLARMYHRGYAVQDDALAFSWYLKAARQGHLLAQNNLAVLYEQGKGVDRDEAEAASWYLRSAQGGLAIARANLGVLYDEGRGVTEDAGAAARWYRLAGESGHIPSQYRLARLYTEGRGVPQDDGKAASWYRKAAKAGHAESQLVLATWYEEGRGVKRDPSKAAKWRRLAAIQGLEVDSATATEVASEPSMAGETDEPEPKPEPSAPDALAGDAALAAGASSVPTEPIDPSEAAAPTTPSPTATLAPALIRERDQAEAGDIDAAYALGRRYASGDGAPLSHQEAGKWYLVAAEGGHEAAGYKIAFQYLRGRGVSKSKDLPRAYFWFTVSAERGVGDAEEWRAKVEKKMNKGQLAEAEQLLAERRQRETGG
jgi:TPR repeat protein